MDNKKLLLITTTLALAMPGCRVVGDIFKAGVWVGVLVVVVLVALVAGIARLATR